MVQRRVVGSNIPSYKSRLFSSSSAFEKKIVLPTSLIEQLNVTFLLENGAKTCRWVKHTFLQKSAFFEFFSIWEENCVADIINTTINCDLFLGKWCKDVSLGQAYLPTNVIFFWLLQHLRTNRWSSSLSNATWQFDLWVKTLSLFLKG